MFRNERRSGACPPGPGYRSATLAQQFKKSEASLPVIPVLTSLVRFVPVITVLNIIVIVVIL